MQIILIKLPRERVKLPPLVSRKNIPHVSVRKDSARDESTESDGLDTLLRYLWHAFPDVLCWDSYPELQTR